MRIEIGLALMLEVLHAIRQSLTASLSVYTTTAQFVINYLQPITAHKIAKSSHSKMLVLRCDLFVSSTRLSFKLVAKKCVTFPDESTNTAPMPALTLEASGSKHASVKIRNAFEIDR